MSDTALNTTSFSIFDQLSADYSARQTQKNRLTLEEYLEEAKNHPELYATPWERLLKAIGDPQIIDFSLEPNLRNVFGEQGRGVTRYKAFDDFYGIEEPIQKIVDFIRSAAQGNEERKQILYLLGPVGGGKSSLARRIMNLLQRELNVREIALNDARVDQPLIPSCQSLSKASLR